MCGEVLQADELVATGDQACGGIHPGVGLVEGLPEGQDDRDSGHHSDDDQGRRQQDPGQPALAIAQRVLLVLVTVALGGRQIRGSAVAVAMRLPPSEKCAEFPAQHLAAPGTCADTNYLIRVCNLVCSACKAASG